MLAAREIYSRRDTRGRSFSDRRVTAPATPEIGMSQHMKPAAESATKTAGAVTEGAGKVVDAVVNVEVGAVEPFVFCANCCNVMSVGMNYPSCIGGSFEGILCCCIALKTAECKAVPSSPEVVCLFENATLLCIKPGKAICKGKQQICCLEHRFGCPCDADAPFSCTICFVEIFRHDECTTKIEPKIKVLPRIAALQFDAPPIPAIVRN